ncbi:MAG TPA: D-Ala-D-Ala carboxypeptidase family metallohydrolase [Methylomirabilota bacterium]|nr:D-Ala-D-Ala carboxypeptidase family metallohydrolase [Methylomirabilota bacterium]
MDSKGSATAAHSLSGTEENETLDASFAYSPDAAPFFARLNGERLPYRINSVFALPSEDFILSVGGPRKNNDYAIQTALSTTHLGPNIWSWRAPREVGLYFVKIIHPTWGVTIHVNIFVLAPFSSIEHGYLNGYRVGKYPNEPDKQREAYAWPRGFIEVTEANENTLVSPHFRLRQFLCKQQGDYPKYIILDPRLLQVLETVLKKVNEQGRRCHTLSIMSGYRTPYYNRAIGNSTTYSRHLWGDAADIFIDVNPRDGEMDDLNGDGVVNVRDAEVLYDIVYDLYGGPTQRYLAGSFFQEPDLQRLLTRSVFDMSNMQQLLTGGLARYRENGAHGPFVHVDVRGVFTSWRQ